MYPSSEKNETNFSGSIPERLSGSVEFSNDLFITKTHLGRLRQCLRVDILPDVLQFPILNGDGEDPVVLRTSYSWL